MLKTLSRLIALLLAVCLTVDPLAAAALQQPFPQQKFLSVAAPWTTQALSAPLEFDTHIQQASAFLIRHVLGDPRQWAFAGIGATEVRHGGEFEDFREKQTSLFMKSLAGQGNGHKRTRTALVEAPPWPALHGVKPSPEADIIVHILHPMLEEAVQGVNTAQQIVDAGLPDPAKPDLGRLSSAQAYNRRLTQVWDVLVPPQPQELALLADAIAGLKPDSQAAEKLIGDRRLQYIHWLALLELGQKQVPLHRKERLPRHVEAVMEKLAALDLRSEGLPGILTHAYFAVVIEHLSDADAQAILAADSELHLRWTGQALSTNELSDLSANALKHGFHREDGQAILNLLYLLEKGSGKFWRASVLALALELFPMAIRDRLIPYSFSRTRLWNNRHRQDMTISVDFALIRSALDEDLGLNPIEQSALDRIRLNSFRLFYPAPVTANGAKPAEQRHKRHWGEGLYALWGDDTDRVGRDPLAETRNRMPAAQRDVKRPTGPSRPGRRAAGAGSSAKPAHIELQGHYSDRVYALDLQKKHLIAYPFVRADQLTPSQLTDIRESLKKWATGAPSRSQETVNGFRLRQIALALGNPSAHARLMKDLKFVLAERGSAIAYSWLENDEFVHMEVAPSHRHLGIASELLAATLHRFVARTQSDRIFITAPGALLNIFRDLQIPYTLDEWTNVWLTVKQARSFVKAQTARMLGRVREKGLAMETRRTFSHGRLPPEKARERSRPAHPAKIILDIGARDGHVTEALAGKNPGARIIAIDPELTPGAVDRLGQLANVEMVKDYVQNWGAPGLTGHVDEVYLLAPYIMSVDAKAIAAPIARLIANVLKPGTGELVMVTERFREGRAYKEALEDMQLQVSWTVVPENEVPENVPLIVHSGWHNSERTRPNIILRAHKPEKPQSIAGKGHAYNRETHGLFAETLDKLVRGFFFFPILLSIFATPFLWNVSKGDPQHLPAYLLGTGILLFGSASLGILSGRLSRVARQDQTLLGEGLELEALTTGSHTAWNWLSAEGPMTLDPQAATPWSRRALTDMIRNATSARLHALLRVYHEEVRHRQGQGEFRAKLGALWDAYRLRLEMSDHQLRRELPTMIAGKESHQPGTVLPFGRSTHPSILLPLISAAGAGLLYYLFPADTRPGELAASVNGLFGWGLVTTLLAERLVYLASKLPIRRPPVKRLPPDQTRIRGLYAAA